MEYFLSAYFSTIFADRTLWDMIRGFARVFNGSLSILAYSVFQVTALRNVPIYSVDSVPVCTMRFMRFWFNKFFCARFYAGCLFRFVRCHVMTMLSMGVWPVRYAVLESCVGDTVLVYGYSLSSYFH